MISQQFPNYEDLSYRVTKTETFKMSVINIEIYFISDIGILISFF